jgi:uncharacterized protein YifE (UPF0438 family)
MSIPEKYQRYFKKPFVIKCLKASEVFTQEEIHLLKKYGNWMKALMDGEIVPATQEQERFVRACKEEAEPESQYERLWMRYLFRLKWEADPSNWPAMGPPRKIIDNSFGGSREATEEMHRQRYSDMKKRSREE